MLQITIPSGELYNELKGEFEYSKGKTIQLEHSLLSVARWEAKWHKPYLDKKEKTIEEAMDYIKCMTVTRDVDDVVYSFITSEQIKEIDNYINDSMTATWFSNNRKNNYGNTETITSELIYYWMVAYNIPFECEKWHISRLLVLIHICSIKNEPPKKRSANEIMRSNAIENAKRKARLHTKG